MVPGAGGLRRLWFLSKFLWLRVPDQNWDHMVLVDWTVKSLRISFRQFAARVSNLHLTNCFMSSYHVMEYEFMH